MLRQNQAVEGAAAGSGLPSPTERVQLGRSIWLLLLFRQWNSPSELYVRAGDPIRATEIALALGVGERQARRDLQRLRRAGYVELQNTGRGYKVRLVNPVQPGH